MRDLSLHLMDIIQNSVSASATKITVRINACAGLDKLEIAVSDNGIGIDEELLRHITDPFVTTRTTRKVGLGISLYKTSAQRADGIFEISSVKNEGTTVFASFRISHIDRLPLGNIEETVVNIIVANPDAEIELVLESNNKNFVFNSAEVKERLGEVPITQYEVIIWMKEFIQEGIQTIFGGVLDEVIS